MYWINRKGDATGPSMVTVITLISLAIVLILSVPLYSQVKEKSEKAAQISVCRDSVVARARWDVLGYGSPVGLECPLIEVESKAKTSGDVLEELVTEMYICWDKFGRGELDFYSDITSQEGKVHCHPCSKIIFDKNAKSSTFGQFGKYLQTEKIPGTEQTFGEFFNNAPNAYVSLSGNKENQERLMDLSKPVYTVFTLVKLDSDDIEELQYDYAKRKDEFGIIPGPVLNTAGTGLGSGTAEDYADKAVVGLAATASVATVGSKALAAVGLISNPIGWGVLLVGVVGGGAYYLLTSTDAQLLVPSLGVYSAEDIAVICDTFG